MEAYGGVKVYLHEFLISLEAVGGWPTSYLGCFSSKENSLVLEHQNYCIQCTEEKNFLLLPEIEPLFLNHWVCVLIAVGTDATASWHRWGSHEVNILNENRNWFSVLNKFSVIELK